MKNYFLLIALLLLVSCKNETKNQLELQPDTIETEKTTYQNVTPLENPSAANSQLPRLFQDGDTLYFSWVTRKDSIDQLFFSVYANQTWQAPALVAQGNDWFTNWADFPAIAANKEAVLINHLQKSADSTYTYDILLNMFAKRLPSPDTNGKHHETESVLENVVLHNDGTKSEHGFVSILPYQDNSFFVTWLDGRNTTSGHGGHDAHDSGGAMTLRCAVVPATGEIAQRTELDAKVCDCCQTSAAMTSNGPVVAYRDRGDDEVRDISIVRQVNGKWLAPQTLGSDHWKIAGCPVNGPSIDAIENSLAVAWFTASNGEGDVKIIFSKDGGETFTRAFRIDSGSATGRVDVVMLENNEAALLWMQPKDEQEMLYVMKVNEHGFTSNPIAISETSPERATGFPQMERLGDDLIFAWTDVNKDEASIKMATIALDSLVMPENAVPHHAM